MQIRDMVVNLNKKIYNHSDATQIVTKKIKELKNPEIWKCMDLL